MALNESGEHMLAIIVIFGSLAIASTALRFWCKLNLKTPTKGLHWDDWWMLAALLCFLGAQAAIIWGMVNGSQGKEITEITAELMSSPSLERVKALSIYLESLFIGLTVSYGALITTKISICLMYRRIFCIEPYRHIATFLLAISLAWFIGTFVANMCICIPVDLFWNRLQPGRCLNFNQFNLINGILEIFIDAAMLAMPVWAVMSLHLPIKTRILVAGIFLVGGFAVITNILKVYYSYQPHDVYVSFNKSMIWINVHISVTILCGSMPTYKPVRDGFTRVITKVRDTYTNAVTSRRNTWAKSTGSARSDSSVRWDLEKQSVSVSVRGRGNSDLDKDLILGPGDANNVTTIESGRRSPNDIEVPLKEIGKTTKFEVVGDS